MAAAIPLVLAMTFICMYLAGIGLQRISLGALIIALGLLVDDAMITVETMVARLEAGDSLASAATYAFTDGCNPRPRRDLLRGGADRLQVGAMEFQCSPEELLSGLIETIYAMRNALLHGEVDPDPRVLSCYEPAYRIVMLFLGCVR